MPLKAQNDDIFQKFGGKTWPFWPPLATPMVKKSAIEDQSEENSI